ncbi:MAG: hypothetical protein KTR18_13730 [Acidiferrobacterales bacterium]|nr:hypothetical protein [Acidiferrobacterales bacterium]
MTLFQSILGWGYLFLCLLLVWYFVAVFVFLLQWIGRQVRFRKLSVTFFKLLASLVITRGVVWLGVHFPHL